MTLIGGVPRTLEIALEDHVDGLEDQTPLIACHINNALGAQDVGALRREQVIEPGRDLAAIDRTVEAKTDAANIVIMDVRGLGMIVAMSVVVAMMMVVPVVMVTMFIVNVARFAVGGIEELRLDGDNPLQIKAATA